MMASVLDDGVGPLERVHLEYIKLFPKWALGVGYAFQYHILYMFNRESNMATNCFNSFSL